MKKIVTAGVSSLLIISSASLAFAAPRTEVTAESLSDRKFLIDAAQESAGEMELGELIAERASNPQLKQFGERLQQDHRQNVQKIEQIASAKNISIPSEAGPASEAVREQLTELSGPQLDQVVVDHLAQSHQNNIQMFERQARTTQDPQVKQFAQNTVSTLRQHLNEVQQLSRSIGGTSGTQGQQAMNMRQGSQQGVQGSTQAQRGATGQSGMGTYSQDQDS